MLKARVIVDTNVLISHLLIKHSPSGRAADRAILETQLLVSESTLAEFADVLGRKKFDVYVSHEERKDFFRLIARISEWVPITATVRACRDPQDDKFLELALSGAAALMVTGDRDLVTLSPYQGCAIVTPAQFLAMPASALIGDTD